MGIAWVSACSMSSSAMPCLRADGWISSMNRNTKPRRRLEEAALPGNLEVGRRRAGRWLEGLADECGVLRARDIVEVLHRRLDVRVAHPFLDAADVGDADDPRSERVAKVVEAERSQCGSFERGAI